MVQDAKLDLVEWFKKSVNDYQNWEEKMILRKVANIYKRYGPEIEKKIFKYVARYAIGHVNSPKVIEGMDSHYSDYGEWKPLRPSYAKRKGNNYKYINTGSLKEYLLGLSAAYWYSDPKTSIDFIHKTVTYYSMFRNGRKPFRAKDKDGHLQEDKLEKNEYEGAGFGVKSPKRPLIEPMEDYLFYEKLDKIVDELINKYMEEEYGDEELIPSTTKF